MPILGKLIHVHAYTDEQTVLTPRRLCLTCPCHLAAEFCHTGLGCLLFNLTHYILTGTNNKFCVVPSLLSGSFQGPRKDDINRFAQSRRTTLLRQERGTCARHTE